MFGEIAGFELRYQLKNPVFWVSTVLFFLLTFFSVVVDEVQIGSRGAVHVNSPFALAMTQLTLSVFFMFVTTAFVANVVVRDDDTGFAPILRSTRISRFDYLYGRFLGAFVACALAFLAIPLAILIGSSWPTLDSEKVGPFRPMDYLTVYGVWVLPGLFFTAAAFFTLATATRSMMATYVGVIAFLMLFLVSRAVAGRFEMQGAVPYMDPFGLGAFGQATRYFSPTERNTLLPPFTGAVAWSRAEWIGLGVAFLAMAHVLFRFETRGKKAVRRDRRRETPTLTAQLAHSAVPVVRSFGLSAQLAQVAARTRFDMAQVFRSPAFFVLMALGLLNASAGLWFGFDGAYGSALHPVTRLVIQTLRGSFLIVPLIVAIYYAGELVWRERDRKTEAIIDSTPAADWTFAAPKMLAITLVLLAMIAASVVAGVLFQLIKGGAAPDLGQYLAWYVIPETFSVAQVAILAVFVQTLVPHKFVGWLAMLGVLLAQISLGALGFEHNLYQYGGAPGVSLSDMNGAAVGGPGRAWFLAYWSIFALGLSLLSYALWRRGVQTALSPRLRRLPVRLAGPPGVLLAACVLATAALGGFIFYNTNVLNAYRTTRGDERWLADYERTLLPFESLPQPKITDVTLDVAVHPRETYAATRGVYVIQNKTDAPIRELHLRFDREAVVRSLSVEGGRPLKTYERFNYRIFALDTPMAPGERRRVSFETWRGEKGFKNSGAGSSRVYANGTFFDNADVSPGIGMERAGLLRDRARRRKLHLPSELRPPKLEDTSAQQFRQLRHDSDWVNADITVSTDADQTPIAPGYKLSDIVAGGRRTARFKTEAPINHFFSIQSARYAEKHERYKGVDLGVFYDPQHPWNVDRMIAALKLGLDYDQAAFSPYQFRQARILEFPDYAQFAQSFAGTIPYSEGIGFLFKPPADPVREGKIDMVTYVTAHELGHQWWAHQVIGSDQQGSTVLVETLAQYSALMAMEHRYGRLAMPLFLAHERDAYLRSRGAEAVEEVPLERVENQGYIHYNKGSLVMYRLREAMGEEAVNRALRRVIADHAFKGAPYPRSLALVDALRAEAGADAAKQALIADLFEKITLYDFKARKAVVTPLPGGRVRVRLEMTARKIYAGGKGAETAAPFDEIVPIGVFWKTPHPGAGRAAQAWSEVALPVHAGANTLTFDVAAPQKVVSVEVDPMQDWLVKAPADKKVTPSGG